MPMHEGEELAIMVAFDKEDNPVIKGYLKPQDKVFTPNEVREAYISASTSKDLREDAAAAGLFNEFRNGIKRGSDTGEALGVYTWGLASETEDLNRTEVYGSQAERDEVKTTHVLSQGVRCDCCQSIDFITDSVIRDKVAKPKDPVAVFAAKKYKPVGLKVRPVYAELPEKYRIKRQITGNPLKDMPGLDPNPRDYCPTQRYTEERKAMVDKLHPEGFLWPEERKLLHDFMTKQEMAFAWNDAERGSFRHDFFPPVEIPVIEHEPWVEKGIPIPRGQLEEFCKIIRKKIDAGVYEPSNSSYRGKFFGVVKKDGKSIGHKLWSR
jgi:hypothetical protein